VTEHVETRTALPRQTLIGGGVFFASGAALVAHILTGAPLPLVLGAAVVLGTTAAFVVFSSAPAELRKWRRRVLVGLVSGLLSTGVYDASRWLLVQVGGFTVSPFKAFPLFGQALLGNGATGSVQQAAGIAFHLLNGMAFGVAYSVWFGERTIAWGIGFGLGLEAVMLTLYPGWLDIRALREFTQISAAGHVAYGASLAFTCRRLLGARRAQGGRS
jgi:hypothetical protein